jgi:hypothetical protein
MISPALDPDLDNRGRTIACSLLLMTNPRAKNSTESWQLPLTRRRWPHHPTTGMPGSSTRATQRVLKFPFEMRRLNASSQLNGIFSIRLSACGCLCSPLLPRVWFAMAGTALQRCSNEIPASRSAWCVRSGLSEADVRCVGTILSFARMSPAEAGQYASKNATIAPMAA